MSKSEEDIADFVISIKKMHNLMRIQYLCILVYKYKKSEENIADILISIFCIFAYRYLKSEENKILYFYIFLYEKIKIYRQYCWFSYFFIKTWKILQKCNILAHFYIRKSN